MCGAQEPFLKINNGVCNPPETQWRQESNGRLIYPNGGFRLDCGCWRQTRSNEEGEFTTTEKLPLSREMNCGSNLVTIGCVNFWACGLGANGSFLVVDFMEHDGGESCGVDYDNDAEVAK